MDCNMKIQSCK